MKELVMNALWVLGFVCIVTLTVIIVFSAFATVRDMNKSKKR